MITASEDDYTSGKATPGTYAIEITDAVGGSTGPSSDETKVEVTFTGSYDAPGSLITLTVVAWQCTSACYASKETGFAVSQIGQDR